MQRACLPDGGESVARQEPLVAPAWLVAAIFRAPSQLRRSREAVVAAVNHFDSPASQAPARNWLSSMAAEPGVHLRAGRRVGVGLDSGWAVDRVRRHLGGLPRTEADPLSSRRCWSRHIRRTAVPPGKSIAPRLSDSATRVLQSTSSRSFAVLRPTPSLPTTHSRSQDAVLHRLSRRRSRSYCLRGVRARQRHIRRLLPNRHGLPDAYWHCCPCKAHLAASLHRRCCHAHPHGWLGTRPRRRWRRCPGEYSSRWTVQVARY